MVQKRLVLLAITVFLGLLVGCGGGQEEAGDYVLHEDPEMGLTIRHPEDWVTHDSFSGLTLASSQEVIDSESMADIGEGGFVTVITGELALFAQETGTALSREDAVPALAMYEKALLDAGEGLRIVEDVQEKEINGQNAAYMVMESEEGGKTLNTILTVVLSDDYIALVSASALADHFAGMRPTLDAIIDTIEVGAPAGIEGG